MAFNLLVKNAVSLAKFERFLKNTTRILKARGFDTLKNYSMHVEERRIAI